MIRIDNHRLSHQEQLREYVCVLSPRIIKLVRQSLSCHYCLILVCLSRSPSSSSSFCLWLISKLYINYRYLNRLNCNVIRLIDMRMRAYVFILSK